MSKLIDRETVEEMVKNGAQLVEVLPAKEYAEDHLPGAVSHPLRQLGKGDLAELRVLHPVGQGLQRLGHLPLGITLERARRRRPVKPQQLWQ